MTKLLSEIASIATGQTFRHKVTNDMKKGRVLAIQIKDISTDFFNINGVPHKVKAEDISQKQLLQKGDVLFLAKGNTNKAVVFNLEEPAVAVSFFFVIRPNQAVVDASYLAWCLNQRETQAIIQRQKEGSLVGSVKKSVLEDLEITLPDISTQKTIANIDRLQRQMQQKTIELLQLQQHLIENQLIQYIQ